MIPAIYRSGLVVAHLCLNAIAFLCLIILLLVGSSKSNVWMKGDDLTRKLTYLINEGTSSPNEFLRALDGEKIVEERCMLPTYSTGRKRFFVKDWKLVELRWEVTLKQLKTQPDPGCWSYELRVEHTVEAMNIWQAIERLMPNGYSRYIDQSIGSSQVSFPLAK